MDEQKPPLNVIVVDDNKVFKRMCDNLDAQNRLALESGTLPPEEETILREVTYPHEAMHKAYELHKYQEESFAEFKKRYLILEKDGSELMHVRNEQLSALKHMPNFASPHGMMIITPSRHDSGIEDNYAFDADDKAPTKPKIPPSNLIMKLMERIHGN